MIFAGGVPSRHRGPIVRATDAKSGTDAQDDTAAASAFMR